MVSALYILSWPVDSRCEIILNRRYKNDLPPDRVVIERFQQAYALQTVNGGGVGGSPPIILSHGINYVYTQRPNNVIFLAVSEVNLNVMLLVMFLDNFYRTVSYFLQRDNIEPKKSILSRTPNNNWTLGWNQHQGSPSKTQFQSQTSVCLTRDTIVDNLVIIFDLLDECMDFGVIQLTDYNILKEYIKVEVNLPKSVHPESDSTDSDSESEVEEVTKKKKKTKKKKTKSKEVRSTYNQANIEDVMNQDTSLVNSSVLRTYSLSINWRPKGIFYAKNEIYLDIIELCEFLYDLGNSKAMRNVVFGTCAVKCYLSGMPVCEVGFNTGKGEGKHAGNQLPEPVVELDEEIAEDNEHEEQKAGSENPDEELKADTDEEKQKETGLREGLLALALDGEGDLSVVRKEVPENHDQETHQEIQESSRESLDVTPINHFSLLNSPDAHGKIRNVQFHQCTKLNSLQRTNLVSFVPPDDKFVLMTYNVELPHKKVPLIMIKPTYKVTETSLQIMCVLNTSIKKRLHCQGLDIRIPINPNLFDIDVAGLKYKTEMGEVNYKIDSSELVWLIPDITGKKMVKMMAQLPLTQDPPSSVQLENTLNNREDGGSPDLDSDESESELDKFYGVNGSSSSLKRRILKSIKHRLFNFVVVTFKIPMMSYSGLKLSYLKVEEELMKYSCFPWVKYVTEAAQISDVPLLALASAPHSYRFKLATDCFLLNYDC